MPKPINKYNPARIYMIFAPLGLFFLMANPIMESIMGGPAMMKTMSATSPPKLPTSNMGIT
jgi:hypothetical protein